MNIGVIGTIWIDIPPKGYGGTEEVIANLVNGLAEKKHNVTLFGPANSLVQGNLIPTVDVPLRDKNISWENICYTLFHMTQAFDKSGDFDILHVHLNKAQDYVALPLAALCKTPVVFTLHFRLPSQHDRTDRFYMLNKYRFLPVASISNAQRENHDLNFIQTVYNGINVASYPFNASPENYFVWLGKVKHDKGTKEAILAAKKAGVTLIVLGAIERGVPQALAYYEQEIKPLIDNKQIIFKEEVPISEKADILGKAKALLNPINWEEPFGLVMTEAQATGTPVIAFARGAAPELIIEGKTGFLVHTVDEMVAKIKEVDSLDRYACRKNVEDNFSTQAMVTSYEKAYARVIDQWQKDRVKQSESNLRNKTIAKVVNE